MKIEAFLLCWNESKIIRHTLNHYSKFCDEITVIDNGSTDDTLKIIEKEYPHVNTLKFDSQNTFRDDIHQYIKNNCWKNSTADWVIVADMDELLYCKNIKEVLQEKLTYCHILPEITGFNMFSETFPDNYAIPITDQIKTGVRSRNFDKQIVFQPQFVKEMHYSPGAHFCNPIGISDKLLDKKKYYIPKFPEALFLLHYKYLGQNYLTEKHKQYATRLSGYNKSNNFGMEYLNVEHVKKSFGLIKNSGKLIKVI